MSTLINGIMQAEALTAQAAKAVLTGLGFEPCQFEEPAEVFRLHDGQAIIRTEYGFISCGHAGEPAFAESVAELICDHCGIGSKGAALYAEAAWKLDLYRPDEFAEDQAPWRLHAGQYAAIIRAEGGEVPRFEPGEYPQSREFGETEDDGVALYFADQSLYYSDGGRHEVWASSSDFEEEYQELISTAED